MKRLSLVTSTLLVVSFAANGVFAYKLYEHSKILDMQTASYNRFKSLLADAAKETDDALKAEPGSNAQKSDISRANDDVMEASGLIMGLRTDFAREGMDVYPVFIALTQSQNVVPTDQDFSVGKEQATLGNNSKTLHNLYSKLSSTSFMNAGLEGLRQAIFTLDHEYPGYPSYGTLR